jgi:hypothetical protein
MAGGAVRFAYVDRREGQSWGGTSVPGSGKLGTAVAPPRICLMAGYHQELTTGACGGNPSRSLARATSRSSAAPSRAQVFLSRTVLPLLNPSFQVWLLSSKPVYSTSLLCWTVAVVTSYGLRVQSDTTSGDVGTVSRAYGPA